MMWTTTCEVLAEQTCEAHAVAQGGGFHHPAATPSPGGRARAGAYPCFRSSSRRPRSSPSAFDLKLPLVSSSTAIVSSTA